MFKYFCVPLSLSPELAYKDIVLFHACSWETLVVCKNNTVQSHLATSTVFSLQCHGEGWNTYLKETKDTHTCTKVGVSALALMTVAMDWRLWYENLKTWKPFFYPHNCITNCLFHRLIASYILTTMNKYVVHAWLEFMSPITVCYVSVCEFHR